MEPIRFQWNGADITAQPGDTVASALFRAGVRTFTCSYEHGRPRGLLCLAGNCPNCMVNVDGVPNIRSCTVPARSGLTVLAQNQNVYRGFESPTVKRFAPAPLLAEAEHSYEHVYLQFDVVVVGGGQSGVDAALKAAGEGKLVALLEKEPGLQASAHDVERAPGISVFLNCGCFGLYEGNLLGAVQIDHSQSNRETLLHLRAGHVVIATGAYETQLLFANNDLPGIILSTAVLRLLRRHAIVPGKRVVLLGELSRCEALRPELEAAGMTIVAAFPVNRVVRAEGVQSVTAVVTDTGTWEADLVVMCGPLVPDVSLLAQARTPLYWSQDSGAFLAEALPTSVSHAGAAAGAGVDNSFSPLPVSATSADAIACLCMDVSGQDVAGTVHAGMGHIELIKRFTKLGKSACQGRMCQTAAVHLCSQVSGQTIAQVGTTVARPPAPPVTLGALAGRRHHTVRRTPMHEQHANSAAVWMDMGEWKRPRYYNSGGLPAEACVEQEYRAVRERAGIIDVSTLGKIEVKGRDSGKLLDLVFTHSFSSLPVGRIRYSVLCDETGTIVDDGTVSRVDEQVYFVTTTTGNVDYVQQWLEWWAAAGGMNVTITNLTAGLASINLAGPRARAVLSQLTECPLATESFPYMTWRAATVAGVPATLMRVGFVGETGWEIVVRAEYGSHLWQQLLQAGASVNLLPFGIEAQRVLRLEKMHIIVGVDTDGLSNPYEAGMGWVVKLTKPDFIGRSALTRLQQEPLARILTGFTLEGTVGPPDGAAVLSAGKAVGWATSVRFSWHVNKLIGMAWITPALAKPATAITLRADGIDYPASVVEEAFYDPAGERLRQ